MAKIAVVTGAGSGVGRAVVIKLAKAGWDIALVGRRSEPLDETIALSVGATGRLIATPCDIGDEASVKEMAKRVIDDLGQPSVLVNSAGLNIPDRSFARLTAEDFRKVVNVNLNGAYYCIAAFLPGMRQARAGTVVNVVSDAGLFGNTVSGAAYIAAKFGLTGLTEALNAEERKNGVRATAISPGAIDTPLLDNRPAPPSAEARARMLQADDVAECVMLAIQLPHRATVEQLLIRPTDLT